MSPVSKTWEKRLISVSLCISDRIFISPDVAYESAGIKPLSSLLIPVVLLLVCAALWMMWSGSSLHLFMFISTAVTFPIFAGEIRSFRYEIHAIGNFATQISLGLVGQTYSLITNRKLVWKTIVFHTALLCYGRPEFESRLEDLSRSCPHISLLLHFVSVLICPIVIKAKIPKINFFCVSCFIHRCSIDKRHFTFCLRNFTTFLTAFVTFFFFCLNTKKKTTKPEKT